MSAHGPLPNDPIPVSPEEMQAFQDFFYRKTGIRLDAKRRSFTDRRLAERMRLTGSRSFRDYFMRVRFQPGEQELQHLINEMTVNETYFLREDYQFDCLVNNMLDEVVRGRAPGDRLRIWSVPCSTGEEPYSLAISILENWGRADAYDIEILASDVDSRVLARARDGLYEERALHRVPQALRSRYFHAVAGGKWQVIDELRQSIDFSLINVVDPAQMARVRQIDVIFCRNLLIYFDEASRRQVAEAFFDCLRPGGFICLGHSESMSRISPLFTPRKFPDALVHQKPLSVSSL
ncbi:CheR family methyltransferase [Rhodobacter capsulatus]|uniref:CheR family methyltransferase n=1 Tax=Rhodobacter capsulatus TaxID=1061 RepID=UPI004028B93D